MLFDKTKENSVKPYGVIIGIISLAAQHGIYLLANELAKLFGFEPILPKIEAIDGLIPILPIFILPYIWAYAFWAMGPMAVSKCKTEHFKNFLAAYLFSCLAGALILTFVPTYMDRVAEGLYDPAQNGLLFKLMRFWYSMDGGDIAYNLFPSFHCINSTICFLGVWGRKEIPKWFQIYSLVVAILIYFSTLFVKQHFILDVISGILIAWVVYILCTKFNLGRVFDRPAAWFGKITKKNGTDA